MEYQTYESYDTFYYTKSLWRYPEILLNSGCQTGDSLNQK